MVGQMVVVLLDTVIVRAVDLALGFRSMFICLFFANEMDCYAMCSGCLVRVSNSVFDGLSLIVLS